MSWPRAFPNHATVGASAGAGVEQQQAFTEAAGAGIHMSHRLDLDSRSDGGARTHVQGTDCLDISDDLLPEVLKVAGKVSGRDWAQTLFTAFDVVQLPNKG